MEQQRQSDAQDQQFREQSQQQSQEQSQQYQQTQPQSSGGYRSSGTLPAHHVANNAPVKVDPKTDTAPNAIARHDYATALRLARPKALAGDANSQHVLGFLYESGSGVPQDYAVAASWNRKAAEQGNDGAQADLGWMYYEGLGVPRDNVQAYKWLVIAGRTDMTARRHMQQVQAAISYDEMSQGLSLAQQWAPK
jgi:TPR repeat protein